MADREYRAFELTPGEPDGMTVEGYAAVFDTPAVLYREGGIDYKEVIDPHAFDRAEMADVMMNYDHGGKPVARTKNGTLTLTVDSHGLRVRADLSGTEEGRRLYEEIRGGYLDKMSFAFVVEEDSYDRSTHTRRILAVRRLYDVAAVALPAYDATTLSARSALSVAVERSDRLKKLKLLLEV